MSIEITFPSADGQAELAGVWHPPTSRATNSAVIVLHGQRYTKDDWPSVEVAEGAAALGLTALRFDFRYVGAGDGVAFEPFREGLSDLIGAYEFLESFGKEIKPRRLYLVGKSLGGLVALRLASLPQWADRVRGVGVLGLVVATPNAPAPPDLKGLKADLLVVQGDHDPYGSPAQVQALLDQSPAPSRLEVIPQAGHSFQPTDASQASSNAANRQKVVQLTLDWLARQEADRPDLRI